MDWVAHADTAAVAALLCGLGGLLVPRLIASLPEPDPDDELEQGEPDKELYADLAARPGLGWRLALVAAVAGALIGLAYGWEWVLTYLLPPVPLLVALGFIDLRTRYLPTRLIQPTYGLVALGIVVTWVATGDLHSVVRAAVAAALGFVVYFVLFFISPRGMAFGDVRLSGAVGLALGHLGWGAFLIGMYSGFLLFGIPGLLLAIVRWDRSLLKARYPYGPAMIVGVLVGVLWGNQWWAAFLQR
jgi:leader peptidase (prepilin peptidase)/N-methyltransferase